MGCAWFKKLFRVGSGLLCFIESWFIVFPNGWLEGISTVGSKLCLWWLACLLAGWLAGSLAYFLACFLNCLLAAFLACLPAYKIVACSALPAWQAGLLASWLTGWAGSAGLAG